MKTTLEDAEPTEDAGPRVKLSVEIEEGEFDKAVDDAFRALAREVKLPGFRPGKAPRKLLESRIGSEVGRQRALQDSLPQFYADALDAENVDAIAQPEIDITSGETDGPVRFDAVVEIRPTVQVPGYDGLRVIIENPEPSDAEIEEYVDRLRGQFSTLAPVERPAADGDHVRMNIAAEHAGEPIEGLTADDYVYPVGTEAPLPELDENLRGSKTGDILEFDAAHPDPDEDDPVHLKIMVKEVQEEVLPEVTDEWVAEASEFETADELREDLRTRLADMKRGQSQNELREKVADALANLVDITPPRALVEQEMQRRLYDMVQRLAQQGMSLEQYLQMTGTDQTVLQADLEATGETAVKVDLALRAVLVAEELGLDDAELDAEVEHLAFHMEEKPKKVRKDLERSGQLEAVRSDLHKRKALEWVIEHVEIVDAEGTAIDLADLGPAPHEHDHGHDGDEDEPAAASDAPDSDNSNEATE